MLNTLHRLLQRFFRKSRTLNHQSLNGFSLVVLILVDIFILVNIFAGLNDISRWHLSPTEAYPCYNVWSSQYERVTKQPTQVGDMVIDAHANLSSRASKQSDLRTIYQDSERDRLGQVSQSCLDYANVRDAIQTPANRQTFQFIDQQSKEIAQLESQNRRIRKQYDSTLLEKVAGQKRQKSINKISADEAKQQLETNTQKINQLKQTITDRQQKLLTQPEVKTFIAKVQDKAALDSVEAGYNRAAFWYPSIQLFFQALFLVPLVLISYAVHRFAIRRNYGLVALLSWHLLAISLIPTLLKVFEFLQIGAFLQWLFDAVYAIFGSLLFLISYIQIALIPLAGFVLIKLIQRISKSGGNPRVQAANRIMRSCCLSCGKKLRAQDAHCPHCGYQQYDECPSCHAMTHRHMPHCTHCGAETGFDPKLDQ